MEIIRLYCSNLDIKPKILLTHFLRYFGFYVEDIVGAAGPDKVDSMADIYILSDFFMEDRENFLDVSDPGKTVLICKDGWMEQGGEFRMVPYEGNSANEDEKFLIQLSEHLAEIVCGQQRPESLLTQSASKWGATARFLAKLYVDNTMLPFSIYTRYFYRDNDLYKRAFQGYEKFVNGLAKKDNPDRDSDLVRYARTYAQFEIDSVCRKNLKAYCYPVADLSGACEELLQKYPENEQIRILQADIHCELEDSWAKAGNEYGDIHLSHCAYANYRRGSILGNHFEDYRSAIDVEQWAIERKSDYFAAWFQIAVCREKQGKYLEAVAALEKVCQILDRKYQEHLLSPMELEYLSKAVIKISQNKTWLGDYALAQTYANIAEDLVREADRTEYLRLVWPNIINKKKETDKICHLMREQITVRYANA